MSHSKRLNLLFPDWQGFGESTSAYHGALQLAKALEPDYHFTVIEVPEQEMVTSEDGVLGLSANLRLLKRACATLRAENPQRTFMIGGTCASEIGPVSYLNQKYSSDLAVLWFDAHGDLNTPESSPSGHFHGMPLRSLLGDGPPKVIEEMFSTLTSEQVVLVGARDLDPPEAEFVREHSIRVLSPDQIETPDLLLSELKSRNIKNVYIHLDLDILDPNDFPHLLMPTPGGIHPDTLTTLLAALAGEFHVVGSSVVEFVSRGSSDGIHTIRTFLNSGLLGK